MVQYEYDAWGNHTVSGSNTELGNLNPFRYRGYFYDTDTGFYYLQTRYYDPEVGRFISPDSVEYATPETVDGLNLYVYGGNNPIKVTAQISSSTVKEDKNSNNPIYKTKSKRLNYGYVKSNSSSAKIRFANFFVRRTGSQTYGVDNFWWGRIKCTSSVYTQTEDAGILYSFVNKNFAGINLWDWLGIEFGFNKEETEKSVYGQMNITPWFHIGESIGGNGLSVFFGIDYKNTSHEITIGIGWAPAVIAVGIVTLIWSGGQTPIFDWWQKIFARS